MVTVKKDHSVKVALDARELNKNVKKHKYQMPNRENLIDIVAERLDVAEGIAWFTTLDLKYAYGQLALDDNLAKHCNFQIVGGDATGTYRFKTGYYGLTIMPTEFQQVMDNELAEFPHTVAFIDDILIVTKGGKDDHIDKVREVMRKLDKMEFD